MENEDKIKNSFGNSTHVVSKKNETPGTKFSEILNTENYVKNETIIKNIPFVLFLAMLVVVYIYNTHQSEKMIREMNKINNEINELRWEYMSSKNELMVGSKQTEVINKLQDSTLKILTVPPKKIVVNKNEY